MLGRQDAGIVIASWVSLFPKVNNGDLSIKHFFGGKMDFSSCDVSYFIQEGGERVAR